MKWSDKTWDKSTSIFNDILNHPFIVELMNGSLAEDKFYFYIQQDVYYLKEYGKTLAIIGSRLPENEHLHMFYQFAQSAILVENNLHEDYLKKNEFPLNIEISPTCLMYKSFLSSQLVTQNIEICLASILPCFWIYKKVGDYILENGKIENNPYKNWIITYGGEDFSKAVKDAIFVCDYYANKTTDENRKKMTDVYLYAAKMEWMFWDSAYKKEKWPI